MNLDQYSHPHPLNVEEIAARILSFVNDGASYKAVREVCSLWYTLAGDRIDKFSNHLWTLIFRYPNANWDWNSIVASRHTTLALITKYRPQLKESKHFYAYLSYNPNTTITDISASVDADWKWTILSIFAKVNWDDIIGHLHMPWVWMFILSNKNVLLNETGWKFVQTHMGYNWNWREISQNPFITEKIVKSNPSYPWKLVGLYENPSISEEVKKTFLSADLGGPDDIEYVSMGLGAYEILDTINFKACSWEDIKMLPQQDCDWGELSTNRNITWNIIQTNLDRPWNARGLSQNPNITWRIVVNNPQMAWDFTLLSYNIFTPKHPSA